MTVNANRNDVHDVKAEQKSEFEVTRRQYPSAEANCARPTGRRHSPVAGLTTRCFTFLTSSSLTQAWQDSAAVTSEIPTASLSASLHILHPS